MTPPDRHPDSEAPEDAEQDELLAALRAALLVADAPPDRVLAAARGAFAWRTIDEELAALVFDSATERAGVRELGMARQLTFSAPGVEIEVMVVDPATRRIVGQLVPGQVASVRLEGIAERIDAASDRYGKFSLDGVRQGPVRITVETGAGTRVVTDWIVL